MGNLSTRYLLVHLFGGLGNQQFQYAVAKLLAKKYDRILILDTSYFLKRYHPVKGQGGYFSYGLTYFSVPEQSLKGVLRELCGVVNARHRTQVAYKKLTNLPFFSFIPKILFQSDVCQESILRSDAQVLLSGYFQNHEILRACEVQLNSIFLPNFSTSDYNLKFFTQARKSGSVSVHVRRGDYIKKKIYSQLSMQYYLHGIKAISERERISVILVFSDDINWVKEQFRFDYPVVFVDATGPAHEHQYIMSLCAHNIIANSTFSWWAAMMNKNINKMVISPKRWFTTEETEDVIFLPESWTLIDE